MKNSKVIKGLYCVLPEFNRLEEYKSFTQKLCTLGADVLQVRIKNKDDRFFYQVAILVRKITKKFNLPLIVNNRIDIAILVSADGVHIGQDDISPFVVRKFLSSISKRLIIGFSTHSVSQAKKAIKFPVDYISIGPVFKTNTKPENKPIGIETVTKVVSFVKNKVPVVAIGGINENNIDLLKNTGINAVAVISGLQNTKNLKSTIEKIKSIF